MDIGCGLGDIIRYLPDAEYIGFDANQKYINAAVKRYGNRGKFLCRRVTKDAINESTSFDIAIAISVLHHLDDKEAIELFEIARSVLKPQGTLFTTDPCYVEQQSRVMRYLLSKDRGQHVRTREEYVALASKIFTNIKVSMRQDMLRIPYTFIIMECKNADSL